MRCQKLSFCQHQHPPLLLLSPGSGFSDGDISWIHWLIRTVILLFPSLAYWTDLPVSTFSEPTEVFRFVSVLSLQGGQGGQSWEKKHNVPSPGSWVWFEAIPSSGQASSKIQLSMFQAGWANCRSLPLELSEVPEGLQIVYGGNAFVSITKPVMSAQNTWEEEYGWFQRLWWMREHLWLWPSYIAMLGYKTFNAQSNTNSFWVWVGCQLFSTLLWDQSCNSTADLLLN